VLDKLWAEEDDNTFQEEKQQMGDVISANKDNKDIEFNNSN